MEIFKYRRLDYRKWTLWHIPGKNRFTVCDVTRQLRIPEGSGVVVKQVLRLPTDTCKICRDLVKHKRSYGESA